MPSAMVLVVVLSGCALTEETKEAAARKGADTIDSLASDADWVTCQARTIGNLRRTLGGDMTSEAWQSYVNWCNTVRGQKLVAPE